MVEHWFAIKDGDPRAVALYRRHYSCHQNNHGQRIDYVRHGFSGTGESMILLTQDCTALFGWRRDLVPRRDGQIGVNCTVFRNEGPVLSSELIREACDLAWQRWPGERLYTYVNDGKIQSTNPGACFKKAGWRTCGRNKSGKLTILELLPPGQEVDMEEATI